MTGKRLSAEQVKAVAIFTGNPEGCFYTNGIERRTRVPGSTVRHFLSLFSGSGCWNGWNCMADTAIGFRPRQISSRTTSASKRRQRR